LTADIVICLCTGHCIVGLWLHGSVLRPSNCPVCRRPITLLVPSEVASLLRDEPEIAPVMNRIEQYNGRFAGAPHSMIQDIASWRCGCMDLSFGHLIAMFLAAPLLCWYFLKLLPCCVMN
uniref:RING-type domain-containing protein n=2 Tax=Aegilops tauschii subsp. strangulata TaxID=200361 RepID=A0A453GS63_AEGTS